MNSYFQKGPDLVTDMRRLWSDLGPIKMKKQNTKIFQRRQIWHNEFFAGVVDHLRAESASFFPPFSLLLVTVPSSNYQTRCSGCDGNCAQIFPIEKIALFHVWSPRIITTNWSRENEHRQESNAKTITGIPLSLCNFSLVYRDGIMDLIAGG